VKSRKITSQLESTLMSMPEMRAIFQEYFITPPSVFFFFLFYQLFPPPESQKIKGRETIPARFQPVTGQKIFLIINIRR
jgi:hypothetical protein